jgi:hypothetical protein
MSKLVASYCHNKSRGKPVYCLDGIRHKGGENLIWALVWNVGTCPLMIREKHKWAAPISVRVPRQGTGAE